MIDLTPSARERLDSYLQRLRSELRGTRSVVADEVEQSVREHIEIALAGAQAPVGTTDVIAVLDRLGPPERWLADEDRLAPLLDGLRRKHFAVLALIGALVAGVGATLIYYRH